MTNAGSQFAARIAASARHAFAVARTTATTRTALFDLLPHLVNGLSLGLLFALIALGFMLIVGLMEKINLAHGSLFALGAYVALQLIGPRAAAAGRARAGLARAAARLALRGALVLAPLLVGVVGMAVELCMRRTYGKDPLYGLLLTFGAAMVIEEAIRADLGHARLRAAAAAGASAAASCSRT